MDATQNTPVFHSVKQICTTQEQCYQKPLHHHPDTAELLLVTEGQGRVSVNNKIYPVRPGSVVLYNAGDWHEEAAQAASPFSALSLCCSGQLMTGLPPGHVRAANLVPVQQLPEFPKLLALLEDMLSENSSSHPNKQQTVQHGLKLFLEVLDRNLRTKMPAAVPDKMLLMRMAQHFIEENCFRDLTLDHISMEIGLSKYYLARQFREVTGISPIQYAIQCRLQTAKRLLETTARPVSDIARKTGYESETHFQQAFKKATGIPPRAYRMSLKNKQPLT